MFSFISRISNTRIDPTGWDPNTNVPAGSTSTRIPAFKSTISAASTVSLVADGAWSHGTVEFHAREGSAPPTYDAAVSVMTAADSKLRGPQLGDGEAFLEVQVEARWNDEELWKEAEVSLNKVGQHNVELLIKTPSMAPSRLASQLSFHVSFFFPPELTGLAGLCTQGAQWRTIGHPSLSGLHFTTLSISTANASIAFAASHADSASLKTANNSITGEYHASTIIAHTDNGTVEGKFYAQGGTIDIHTTNEKVNAIIRARKAKLYNRNGPVKGDFIAQERIAIDNSNGKISGDFSSGGELDLTTSNSPIEGTFKVAQSLVAKTSNAKVEIRLILGGASGADDRGSQSDLLAGVEHLRDVKNPDGPGAIARSKVTVTASSSNSSVTIDVVEHPESVDLEARVKTSNASGTIKHFSPCDATFDLSTSNSPASVTLPSHHRAVYLHQSSHKCDGTIQSPGNGLLSSNTFKISSSNARVAVIVE